MAVIILRKVFLNRSPFSIIGHHIHLSGSHKNSLHFASCFGNFFYLCHSRFYFKPLYFIKRSWKDSTATCALASRSQAFFIEYVDVVEASEILKTQKGRLVRGN